MNWDLTASTREHGAQRMLSATTLVCEACVVFFATLVAHGLLPEIRLQSWIFGLILTALLAFTPRLFKNGKAAGYWLGLILQLVVIAFGFLIPAMFFIGLFFAALYIAGLVKGQSMDREKDTVDFNYHQTSEREADER